jgi:serralysin
MPESYEEYRLYTGASMDPTQDWAPLDAEDRQKVREAFAELGSFLGIDFYEVPDQEGVIRFGYVSTQWAGYASYPGPYDYSGDVWLSYDYDAGERGTEGTYGYSTILHELGHALGLEHPFDGDVHLPEEEDNDLYSLMSYTNVGYLRPVFETDGYGVSCEYAEHYRTDYGIDDIAALQAFYGPNGTYHDGADLYELSDLYLEGGYRTIWDGGGEDTLDLSLYYLDKAAHKYLKE